MNEYVLNICRFNDDNKIFKNIMKVFFGFWKMLYLIKELVFLKKKVKYKYNKDYVNMDLYFW